MTWPSRCRRTASRGAVCRTAGGAAPLGRSHEVILVDDGSRDGTGRLIHEIAGRDPNFRAIRLQRNFGQTAAIMAGIEHAAGDVIIPMDGDPRNDPKDIGPLLDKPAGGYDAGSGRRQNRRNAFLRSLFSRIADRLIPRVSDVRLHDYGGTLKAYPRDIIEGIRLYGGTHRFVPIRVARQVRRIAELEVPRRPRRTGRLNCGFGRILEFPFDLPVGRFLMRYDINSP